MKNVNEIGLFDVEERLMKLKFFVRLPNFVLILAP